MYESPINLTYNDQHIAPLREGIDAQILKAIMQVGIDVNRDELIKALEYDRAQYDKGYNDGFEDGIVGLYRSIPCDKWIDAGYSREGYANVYICPYCKNEELGKPNFCSNCGAYLRKDLENV